jgi:hypothetical protein
VAHHPQREVEDVDADVDARPAARVLLVDEAWPDWQPGAAQHPRPRVVDVAQRAARQLGLERLGVGLEAEVLRGHQELAGLVARLDHLADLVGRRRQRLLANDVLARFERGDGKRRVKGARRANIDDVEVGVLRELGGIGVALLGVDAHLVADAVQHIGVRVSERDDFGVRRGFPAGEVRTRNTSDSDHANFKCLCHFIAPLCSRGG